MKVLEICVSLFPLAWKLVVVGSGVERESCSQYNKMPVVAQSFQRDHSQIIKLWFIMLWTATHSGFLVLDRIWSPRNIVSKKIPGIFWNIMFSSRWFLLKSQTANRTTAWSCFPLPWLIIAFQSEYLPETGLRSLCMARFPPCCLSPHVAENVPYTSEQWCAVKFASVYTLSNCSVPWGCWGLRDGKQWQG